jgi:TPR repeat protein
MFSLISRNRSHFNFEGYGFAHDPPFSNALHSSISSEIRPVTDALVFPPSGHSARPINVARLKQQADAGSADAQARYAFMLLRGERMAKNPTQAVRYFKL